MSILPETMQATNGIFQRTRKNNSTVCMETQKTSNSQSNPDKEERNWTHRCKEQTSGSYGEGKGRMI